MREGRIRTLILILASTLPLTLTLTLQGAEAADPDPEDDAPPFTSATGGRLCGASHLSWERLVAFAPSELRASPLAPRVRAAIRAAVPGCVARRRQMEHPRQDHVSLRQQHQTSCMRERSAKEPNPSPRQPNPTPNPAPTERHASTMQQGPLSLGRRHRTSGSGTEQVACQRYRIGRRGPRPPRLHPSSDLTHPDRHSRRREARPRHTQDESLDHFPSGPLRPPRVPARPRGCARGGRRGRDARTTEARGGASAALQGAIPP